MKLSSDAFDDGGSIPSKFTCDGEDISPPLSISEIDKKTNSLALVVDDPDAPGGTFDHWLIWNISADINSIPQGVPTEDLIKELGGANQGKNDFGQIGYRGPCPPTGPSHRYRFKLYALNDVLELESGASKRDLENAMEDHILQKADLTGTYKR